MTDEELSDVLKAVFNSLVNFMKGCVFTVQGVEITLWQLVLFGVVAGVVLWGWHELTD